MGNAAGVSGNVVELFPQALHFVMESIIDSGQDPVELLDVDGKQGQTLANVIVEFPRDARALFFLRLYQAPAEFHAGGRQFLTLGDIEATADIAGKSAVTQKTRHT